jgi:hypothetical protein
MDALIAERVFGYPPGHKLYVPSPGGGATRQVYSYSTSMADAWLVVERMHELGWYIKLTIAAVAVRARFFPLPANVSWSHGDTAPETICRAALRALESRPRR